MTNPANLPERRVPVAPQRGARAPRFLSVAAALAAALGVVNIYNPPRVLLSAPFADIARDSLATATPSAAVARAAFGKSGGVNVRFALPNDTVTYPVSVTGARRPLLYQWVRLDNQATAAGAPRALVGTTLVAPSEPGFYQLALVSGDLPLSKHFRLGDFLTHDSQRTWPRYAAVSPRLLDKLELVLAEIARVNGRDPQMAVTVEVNSGFRTPLHNGRVKYAAGDSRHQYGDAADVKIDANFDGRFTALDARLVALAAEMVERRHPELVGGIGLYTSRRYTTPYVHIDARGKRARWRS